jgi:hypothetical protein
MNVYCHGEWSTMRVRGDAWYCDTCGKRLWKYQTPMPSSSLHLRPGEPGSSSATTESWIDRANGYYTELEELKRSAERTGQISSLARSVLDSGSASPGGEHGK